MSTVGKRRFRRIGGVGLATPMPFGPSGRTRFPNQAGGLVTHLFRVNGSRASRPPRDFFAEPVGDAAGSVSMICFGVADGGPAVQPDAARTRTTTAIRLKVSTPLLTLRILER